MKTMDKEKVERLLLLMEKQLEKKKDTAYYVKQYGTFIALMTSMVIMIGIYYSTDNKAEKGLEQVKEIEQDYVPVAPLNHTIEDINRNFKFVKKEQPENIEQLDKIEK